MTAQKSSERTTTDKLKWMVKIPPDLGPLQGTRGNQGTMRRGEMVFPGKSSLTGYPGPNNQPSKHTYK